MPAYYDSNTKTWFCKFYYTDFTGKKLQKKKRGFKLKRDADSFERDFLEHLPGAPAMPFETLAELYLADKRQHTKPATYSTKKNRIETWLLPAFSGRRGHISRLYAPEQGDRLFPMITRSGMARSLEKHAALAGVKRIRVHDLRHSHASLLIEMGFSAILVSERLGHENVSTTLNIYAHLFPSKQSEVSDRLQALVAGTDLVLKNHAEEKDGTFSRKTDTKNQEKRAKNSG